MKFSIISITLVLLIVLASVGCAKVDNPIPSTEISDGNTPITFNNEFSVVLPSGWSYAITNETGVSAWKAPFIAAFGLSDGLPEDLIQILQLSDIKDIKNGIITFNGNEYEFVQYTEEGKYISDYFYSNSKVIYRITFNAPIGEDNSELVAFILSSFKVFE